jgi:hypothetical protein
VTARLREIRLIRNGKVIRTERVDAFPRYVMYLETQLVPLRFLKPSTLSSEPLELPTTRFEFVGVEVDMTGAWGRYEPSP